MKPKSVGVRVLNKASTFIAQGLLCGLIATSATAATFHFTFDNEDGLVSGSVVGRVVLPDGDGTFAALSVTILSAPAGLGFDPTGTNFCSSCFGSVFENSFTVLAGAVTAVDFFGLFNPDTALGLRNLDFGNVTFLDRLDAADIGVSGVLDADNSSLRFFVPVSPVPLPSSFPLMVGALGMVGWAARRGSSRG